MAEGSPSSKVKFLDDNLDRPTLVKHVPTQKYNRKEIQKRLEVETWMDEKLKDLFESDVSLQYFSDESVCNREAARNGLIFV
jgi:hypothetical protein